MQCCGEREGEEQGTRERSSFKVFAFAAFAMPLLRQCFAFCLLSTDPLKAVAHDDIVRN